VGIDALLPGWREDDNNPFKTPVMDDRFLLLTKDRAIGLPHALMPKVLGNDGNYIVSLGNVCRWLATKAEELGIEIYPGFAAADLMYDDNGAVIGVITGDMGIERSGERGPNYTPGMALLGKYVLIGEGVRGSLAKQLIAKYDLEKGRDPQKFGIGFKELWRVKPENHMPGLVQHSFGWPLDMRTGGGSFLYHLKTIWSRSASSCIGTIKTPISPPSRSFSASRPIRPSGAPSRAGSGFPMARAPSPRAAGSRCRSSLSRAAR
jgi:electron-transferring-flavoprotein dehydrogenase